MPRRDTRNFITVVATMPEHPKAEGLTDAAFRALIEAWCWCFRQENDGYMSAASWERRGSAKVRAELLREGWVDALDDGRFYMHDYTEHQQSRADRDALSAARAEAGRRGGQAKAAAKQAASKGLASATANAKHPASKHVPEQNRTEQIPTASAVGAPPLAVVRDDSSRREAESAVSQYVAWCIDRRAPKPPRSVISRLVDQAASLIAEDQIPRQVIDQALIEWHAAACGPTALPSFVHQVQNPRRPRPTNGGGSGFDPDRAMQRALAREAAEA